MKINFTHPLLLLLIIPGIVLGLYSFFRVNKRFRYSRNHVISLIVFMIMNLSVSLMVSGMSFTKTIINKNNEVILLMDDSFSSKTKNAIKDEFVLETINNTPENVSLGIVRFGYDQVIALPLTNELKGAYNTYLSSNKPNEIASNLDEALMFTSNLFKNKENAKIVIVSDLIETDGNSLTAIKNLTLEGITIDYHLLDSMDSKNEVVIKELVHPTRAISKNKEASFDIIFESNVRSDVGIEIYDNDSLIDTIYTSFREGTNKVNFKHKFLEDGVHKLTIKLDASNDLLEENNLLNSYFNLDIIDGILILERNDESALLKDILLGSGNELDAISRSVDVLNIKEVPNSIDYLRQYNEVILNNIANADMNNGFIEVLNQYVYDYGGGLLTVAGTKTESGETVNNTYSKEDLENTLYQDMLPVIAEEYVPPVGLMVAVDVSGSMGDDLPGGTTKIEQAKSATKHALNVLDPRDYMGVISFSDDPTLIVKPTPVVKKTYIESQISTITPTMKGTVYSGALDMAGRELGKLPRVNKKHVILVSDGQPGAGDTSYMEKANANRNAGITTSCISFQSDIDQMRKLASIGGGRYYVANDGVELERALRSELEAQEIREFEYKTFTPSVGEVTSIYDGVSDIDNLPKLDGFYGTRIKRNAKTHMIGEYGEPLLASIDYGSGKVSSAMFDLKGDFSSNFINSNDGKKIIRNLVNETYPLTSVIKKDIDLELNRQNTIINADIYTSLEKNETLKLSLSKVKDKNNSTLISEEDIIDFKGSAHIKFHLTDPGLYEVKVSKLNGDNVVSETIDYITFDYSKEYDPFINKNEFNSYKNNLNNIIGGSNIDNPIDAFASLKMTYIKKFDPRYVLAVITLIGLLINVFLMKFKFKWPHELIRDYKRKKGENK